MKRRNGDNFSSVSVICYVCMMKQALREAIVIVLCAVAVALAANYFRPDGLALVRTADTGDDGKAGTVISIEKFLETLKSPATVILDARSHEDFETAHIPGAKSLPEGKAMEEYPFILHDSPFDRTIVVYCSSLECDSAEEVAMLLRDVGYSNVKVYAGGWEEWEELGLPYETSY